MNWPDRPIEPEGNTMFSIKNSCLALFMVSSLFFVSQSTAEEMVSEFACNTETLLQISLELGIPVIDDKFVTGCSLLPESYKPTQEREISNVGANCGSGGQESVDECPVKIVEVIENGRYFYIAYGWLEGVEKSDPDLFEKLMDLGIELPTGLPCEIAACAPTDLAGYQKLVDTYFNSVPIATAEAN